MQQYYHVRFGGCGHDGVLSETDLKKGAKGQQINPDTMMMTKENLYTCDSCLNMEPGYCSDSVLHPIIAAKKLSSLQTWQPLGELTTTARTALS